MASRSYSPGGQSLETSAFNFTESNCGVSSSIRIWADEDDISSMRSDIKFLIILVY
ncbi:MAG: hypothetical protein ACI8Q3_000450, partial [Marinomonas primoryensis]